VDQDEGPEIKPWNHQKKKKKKEKKNVGIKLK
jgi:hypothetical protein